MTARHFLASAIIAAGIITLGAGAASAHCLPGQTIADDGDGIGCVIRTTTTAATTTTTVAVTTATTATSSTTAAVKDDPLTSTTLATIPGQKPQDPPIVQHSVPDQPGVSLVTTTIETAIADGTSADPTTSVAGSTTTHLHGVDPLPATGSNTNTLIGLAFGLSVVGVTAITIDRKRVVS